MQIAVTFKQRQVLQAMTPQEREAASVAIRKLIDVHLGLAEPEEEQDPPQDPNIE